MFCDAAQHITTNNNTMNSNIIRTTTDSDNDQTTNIDRKTLRNSLFLHVRYHPKDISRQAIRKIYNDNCENTFKTKLGIQHTTVAYNRGKNIKETLTSGRFKSDPSCRAVSEIFTEWMIEDNPSQYSRRNQLERNRERTR